MSITAVPLRPIKPGSLVKLWIALGVLILLGIGVAWAQTSDPVASFMASNGKKPGVVTTQSGLEYQVLKPGAGASPTLNDVALVNYVGKLIDGTTFDANNGVPMQVGAVVPGFQEALMLMKPGGKYRFWLPLALGYGDKEQKDQSGKVVIPAHAVLVFDVDLLAAMSMQQAQAMMQAQQQGMGAPPPQ